MRMEISTRKKGDWLIVDVVGEVSFMSTQPFIEETRRLVEENPDVSFLFNFTECPHLGTLCLGTLLELHKAVCARGRGFRIMNLDDQGRFRLESSPVEPPPVFVESEEGI